MSHFSPDEFVDAAEGTLAADRAAHLQSCAQCRDQAAATATAIGAAREVDVPEPSPLYWPHLAARVRERVANETIAPAWRSPEWWHAAGVRRLVPIASAAVLCAAIVVTGLMTRDGRAPAPLEPVALTSTAPPVDAAVPIEETEVWLVLTSAAAETPIEEAHAAGMGIPAGAIDRAVQQMTPDELTELGRLLQSELRRSGD
jgi:hypothetical protein